jgi:hypothetical protein
MGNEKLRTIGVWPSVRHRKNPWLIVAAVWFAFTLEFVARISPSGPIRTAALDHEIRNDTVEGQPIVEPARGKVEK